jgi:hypothetical protein
MMRMPHTLHELKAGSVLLRAVFRTVLIGPVVLQQCVLHDLHIQTHAKVKKKVYNEGNCVKK